jgi:arylsulfatase A-like enzyme
MRNCSAKKGDYYTDKLTDAALDFIERNKDRPFFVHLEHFAGARSDSGSPGFCREISKETCGDAENRMDLTSFLESNPDGTALTTEELKALAENDELQAHQDARVWWVKQKQDNVEFAGMLQATDESLGRIRKKLRDLGLADNTIVIFHRG